MSLPFCPESPRYLFINRGKEKEAEAALRRLRGNPEMVMKEMEEMREEAAHSETGVTVREFLRKRRYRRNAILIVNALSMVGASLMFMSKVTASFEVLIVGRLIFGLFCGLVMSLNPLYIQGVSPTNLRDAFATLNQVSFASGILLGMVVGLETVLGMEKYWSLILVQRSSI
ncbi:solute carrier family 2, facilitated glucose transporter member 3-like [Sinocyclocheilus rhinocerous]|uniref:solute carrier family 2, facilitated glucose transporter member 3-like n=1 Tax=Sinocyclocheilus rhinocerous TaxID=307959 RepID=UPI0007B7BBF3|nr:PREDICTED: solute carrier family 2, facilitated glucose transporter member 3-like [Sinocyclocheilus rhinocerous]